MGAILAVFGEAGDPELPERLEKMIAVSPYRGKAERILAPGAAMAIQTLGWDASIATVGNFIVAFHGFIGNWDELAPALGLRFEDGASNAERLGIAFESVGERLFARLRGEFAVVILDRSSRVVTAARDVYGVRPLFVLRDSGRDYLAAEIKQVLAGSAAQPRLDETFLASWLVHRYGDGGETMYQGVRRLVPGHAYALALDTPGQERRRAPYWKPPQEKRERRRDEASYAEELRAILDRAVGRSLAERPGAVALSGGMDSPTIWALIRRRAQRGDRRAGLVGAVTLRFPGFDCDETALVREIIAMTGGDGTFVDATAVAPFDLIEMLARVVEGPFIATQYHGSLIADAAKEMERCVVYYGFGGDEWLTGSPHYLGDELRRGHVLRVLADARAVRLGRGLARLRGLVRHTIIPVAGPPWSRKAAVPAWLHPSRRGTLLLRPRAEARSRSGAALLNTLTTHRAASYFGNAELVAAQAGVELRCPLCDLDLIEFAFRAPGRVVMGGQRDKHLMRVSTCGLLPRAVVDRRRKVEFSGPIRSHVRAAARQEDVSRWHLVVREIVVPQEVQRLRAEVETNQDADGFHTFMRLLVAERVCTRFDS